MLSSILKDVTQRFNNFLLPQVPMGGKQMILGDIAKHSGQQDSPGSDTIQNNLVLTLVSVEEENSLKNNYPLKQEQSVAIRGIHYRRTENSGLLLIASREVALKLVVHFPVI
ncbi:hypothetical protein FHS57_006357 [Runella defluvii]|uniref:Uncharacterized protein n=1 Tax=Runella defluvii TaxID=370973 RepID=A0A7W6EUE7_9BACT|nr:hypothetical protein [Runella defluvii]MBB3842326.1 hypothetical protein [Runella defluvii]